MRKLLLLLCALLGMSSAWAETITVNAANGTFYNGGTTAITPSSSAQYASKWVSTATDPQLTVSCSKNDMVVDDNFRIHTDTYVLTPSAGYKVESWSITAYTNSATASTIAGESISTDAENPTEVKGTSSSFAVSTASPWIVVTEFTVEVVVDPNYVDPNVVKSSVLSGSSFTLNCKRGYIGSDGTKLLGTTEASEASTFAIVTFADQTYLYDATNKAFVCHTTAAKAGTTGNAALESSTDLSKALTGINLGFTEIKTYPYYLYEETYGNWLNMDGGLTVYMNTWTDFEGGNGGNTYAIEIVDDNFDAADAIAALDEYFHGPTAFNEAIEKLEAFTYGKGLGKYSLTSEYAEYAGNEANVIASLKEGGYSKEALAKAQALLDATYINLPVPNTFLRITSTHGTYLSGTESAAQAGRLSFTDTEDNTTIFYYDGNYLYDLANGCAAAGRAVGVAGSMGVNYWFEESTKALGKYAIRFNPDGGNNRFLYAWDTSKNYADQNGSDHDNCVFTLTEVTELPVAVTDAGYATFFAPVALYIPEGVEAYTGEVGGNALKLTALEGKIPAATAVVLKAAAGDYNFTTTTADAFAGTNDLKGTVGGKATSSDVLTLQQINDVVGFYTYTGETLAGFKAYLDVPAEEVKGLTLQLGEETAISRIEAQTGNGAVYNLAGQRVVKAQKGLYIMGGKKVVVK